MLAYIRMWLQFRANQVEEWSLPSVKVTTERLPKSLLLVDVELDADQVEKSLDRAARRLSEKYTIPGFRKGKAPRFIIENYFGREALMEEAKEDLINKSFKKALEQEQINPIGQPTLESIEPSDSFRFRVKIPIAPTVTLPDYRSIRLPLEVEPVTEEGVQRAMNMRRERHVVLKELDEARPAQPGDQLTVKLETLVEGESLEQHPEGEELPDTPLVLEPDRLVDELYAGLLGAQAGDTCEIVAQMPEDHASEQVRGKEVTFKVQIVGIQERLLPNWEELPLLEDTEGTLDSLREQTRQSLEAAARSRAEQRLLDGFIEQVVAGTTYDVPDVLIRETAEDILEYQGRQYEQYGVTLEQMLTYRNQTHDQAIDELLPTGEENLHVRLALQAIVRAEQLDVSEEELQGEMLEMLQQYSEQEVAAIAQKQQVSMQFMYQAANAILDRKLRTRLLSIASGEAPELSDLSDNADSESSEDTEDTEDTDVDPMPDGENRVETQHI